MLDQVQGTPIVDEQTVSELVRRDNADDSLFDRLFGIYCDEYPTLLQDLREAKAASDTDACYEAIHQMKGSSAAMGAARVYGLAKAAIELCASAEILERDEVEGVLRIEMEAFCAEIKKRRS